MHKLKRLVRGKVENILGADAMTDTYTALKEDLREGVPLEGSNEDDSIDLYDVEAANETMHDAAEAITTLQSQLAEAREALPDYIDLFRIIRDAGRTDAAKADAVAKALGALKDQSHD
jgi:predicted RNA-binding Zn ribbon-like protein